MDFVKFFFSESEYLVLSSYLSVSVSVSPLTLIWVSFVAKLLRLALLCVDTVRDIIIRTLLLVFADAMLHLIL